MIEEWRYAASIFVYSTLLLFNGFFVTIVLAKIRLPFGRTIDNFAIGISIGPIFLAWLVWLFLHTKLGISIGLWVVAITTIQAGFCIQNRRLSAICLADIFRSIVALRPWSSHSKILTISVLLIIILILLTLLRVLGAPLEASDPMEYFSVSRLIYEFNSFAHYPVSPSIESGLYARSSHPPAYHVLLAVGYAIQGTSIGSWAGRAISLHYAISSIALLLLAMRMHRQSNSAGLGGVMAVAFLFCIPVFTILLVALHIDTIRVCLFFASFLAMAQFIKQTNERQPVGALDRQSIILALVTGAVSGFAAFSHSIGILTLPMVGLSYLIFLRIRLIPWLTLGVAICLACVIISAGPFLLNLSKFGTLIHDSEPIWSIPAIDHANDVLYRRDLVALQDRFFNGLLVWFSNIKLFSFSAFVVLILLPFHFRKIWSSVIGRVMLVGLVTYHLLGLATILFGTELMIKNFRYMYTIGLHMVFAAGLLTAETFFYLRRKFNWFIYSLVILLVFGFLGARPGLTAVGGMISKWQPVAMLNKSEQSFIKSSVFPSKAIFKYIDSNIPEHDKILTFRQAELSYYFPNRRWIYDFDEKIEFLFYLKTKMQVHQALINLGARYVLLPAYSPATYYNSLLIDVVNDPALATEVQVGGGFRLVKLWREPKFYSCTQPQPEVTLTGMDGGDVLFIKGDHDPDFWRFGRINDGLPDKSLMRGVAPQLKRGEGSDASSNWDDLRPTGSYFMLWARNQTSRQRLVTERGELLFPGNQRVPKGQHRVTFAATMKGVGLVDIYMLEYSDAGFLQARRIWDGVLKTSDVAAREVSVTSQLSKNTRYIRYYVQNSGNHWGSIKVNINPPCFLEYKERNLNVPIPFDIAKTSNPFRDWTIANKGKNRSIVPSTEGRILPLTRMRIQSECHGIFLRCTNLLDNVQSGALFFEDVKKQGKSSFLNVPPGYIIHLGYGTGERGLRTLIYGRLSRWYWFVFATEQKYDRIISFLANSVEQLLPNNPTGSVVPVRITARIKTRRQIVIGITIFWKGSDGKSGSYFADMRQIKENDDHRLEVIAPIPTGATDINVAFSLQSTLTYQGTSVQISDVQVR